MAKVIQFNWNNFFRDKHGKVVAYQPPNKPLVAFALCSLVAAFASGWLFVLAALAAGISLGIWAYWEIVSGASPFRQMLGWIAAALLAITAIAYVIKIL